jgi:hypothetical protein
MFDKRVESTDPLDVLIERICYSEDFCDNLNDRLRILENSQGPFLWKRQQTAKEIIDKQLDKTVYVKDVIEIIETMKKGHIEHPFIFTELTKLSMLLEQL